MKMRADLLVLDLETNARPLHEVKITQIGAVLLEATTLRELSSFGSYVDGRPLAQKSIEVTGITEAMLEGKPSWKDVGPAFYEWANKASQNFLLAAWGAHYDMSVLRMEAIHNGLPYDLPGSAHCIKSAFYSFCWERGVPLFHCGVSGALRMLGLEFEGKPHDAVCDARNTARIVRGMYGVDPPSPTTKIKVGTFVKTGVSQIPPEELEENSL